MAFHTLLVYFRSESSADHLATAAAKFAGRQNAKIIGLFVAPRIDVYYSPVGIYVPAEAIESAQRGFADSAEKIAAVLSAAAKRLKVDFEWRYVESSGSNATAAALGHSRVADLVMVCQSELDDLAAGSIAEDLMLIGGRPVLIIPKEWDGDGGMGIDGPSNVMIAWNGSREAARALFDALPILTTADTVTVVTVGSKGVENQWVERSCDDVLQMLNRHGINARADNLQTEGASVGEVLIRQLHDCSADLLVMGGYGHSRMREWALGGVTRHVLHQMPVPVLMSH